MLTKPIKLGVVFVLFGLAFAPAAFGRQSSLGEAARRERERRQQNPTAPAQTAATAPDTPRPSIFFGPEPTCPADLEVSTSGVKASDELEMRLISNLQRARDRKLVVCSWDLTNKLAGFYLAITDFPDRMRVYDEEVSYAERTLGPTDLLTMEIHTEVGRIYIDSDTDKALAHLQAAAAASQLPYEQSMVLSSRMTLLEMRLYWDKPEKEIPVFQKQLELLLKVDFSPYPSARSELETCFQKYAALLRKLGRNTEADKLDEQLKTLPPLQPNYRAPAATNNVVRTPAPPPPPPPPGPASTIPSEGQCPQLLVRDLARVRTDVNEAFSGRRPATPQQESDLQSLLEKARAQKLVACSWDIAKTLDTYYLASMNLAADEKNLEEELRFAENSLGREHLQVLQMHLDVAHAYTTFQGNYERAQQHLEVLARSGSIPRFMLEQVAGSLDTLADLYADPTVRNDPARAITVYEETIALYERLAGKDGKIPELTLENYEEALRRTGRTNDADSVHARLKALDPGIYFDVPDSPKDLEVEREAIDNISRIDIAETNYRFVHGKFGTIAELIADGNLDKAFAGPVLSYRFTVTLSPNSRQFKVLAKPEGGLGRYSFTIAENGAKVFAGGPPGTPVGEILPKIYWDNR
jgi:hypothetical protein